MISAAIIGASGYSGFELMRLLSHHPDVEIRHVTASTHRGRKVDDLFPSLTNILDLSFESIDHIHFSSIDVAFIALPSGESMNIVPSILKEKICVIDLSGDYRITSPSLYEEYYKRKHTSTELLNTAVYGLPELNFTSILSTKLISNPGCYPTSAILALLPALSNRIIHSTNIVINAMSGASGAGRSASIEMSFCEINENVRAYKITDHQHVPEIESILSFATNQNVQVSFIPHVIPIHRGIYSTIVAQLQTEISIDILYAMYHDYYTNAPFVRIKKEIPHIKDVYYTNYCDMALVLNKKTNQLIIISVIDNLIKGAAGQAIQNMNIMFGLPQELGLK